MYNIKTFLFTLLIICSFSKTAKAQLLEVKNELDERAVSIKTRDGVPSSRIIVSSSLSLSYSSNMGDIDNDEVGYGEVNGLNSDTIYFYLQPDDSKRIVTISADGYPPVNIPFTFSPKQTYRCMVFDPNKVNDSEATPAANTANWQYMMAENFDFGRDGFNKDELESLKWYEKAADQGHGLSQITLGVKYASGGNEFAKDVVKSARWFLIAAQQNYDTAQYAIANCFLQGNGVKQDSTKAYGWFQQAAEKGIDEARYRMAHMLLSGYGSDTQVGELMEWFEFFANENRPEAQYMYSKLLLARKASTENNSKAVEYLNRAIAFSNIDAMLLLGEICLGHSINQYNVIKGMELLRMAENLGSNEARALIDQYDNSLPDSERFVYTKHFADNGNGEDMVKLANMYYHGVGTELNYDTAINYFAQAIGVDEIPAAYTGLGLCYYYGRGVNFDYAEAFECFSKGSKDGDSVATSGLGMCYFFGQGVEANADKAYELFVKANDGTNGTALNGIGLCFYYGRPLAHNKIKAQEFFEQALELDPYNAGLSLGDLYQTKPDIDAQLVKESYTIAAEAGNPEAQNKLGLFIINNGYRTQAVTPTKHNPATSILIPPTEQDIDEAKKWFKMSIDRESFKGEYNYAYSHIFTLTPEELMGSQRGKQAVEIFLSAAQKGSIEAMAALASYYTYDIGIDAAEAYKWLSKAVELESVEKNRNIYKALLGALMFDQAVAIAAIDQTPVLEIQNRSAALMEESINNRYAFLYPRLYHYYREVIGDKKTARERAKVADTLMEFQKVEPVVVAFQL